MGQSVCYTCLSGNGISDRGMGKILNISSAGVRFTTERILSRGVRMELSIDWPVLLDNTCLMKLVIQGCLARSDTNAAVVKVEHYEFRTRAANPIPSLPCSINLRT